MAKEDNVSTEVPSYFLGSLISGIGNIATSAGSALASGAGHLASAASHIPVVGNVLSGGITSLGNGLGQVVSGNIGGGLNSMYLGADKLLGGVLPGGQSFGAGYLGNLYGKADRALGGYLPNVGGVGATPAQMSGAALNSGGSYGLQPGQVGTSFNGGPMTVSSVNTPLASGGMSGWDKLAYGIQGAGLLGSIFSGNKNQAQQAAMMMPQPRTVQPGAGAGGGAIGNAIRNDPAMAKGTGVGGASSRGADKNKTPGLDQVTAGVSDKELLGQIKSTRQDIEELLANMEGIDGQEFSPMESARKSGLGMDTEGQSYFSVSGSF